MIRGSISQRLIPLISISIILFFLGIFGFLAIAGSLVSTMAQDALEMKVLLADFTDDSTAQAIIKQIDRRGYARKTRYVTKEQALKEFKALGEDFSEAMDGQNILPPTIYVLVKPEYMSEAKVIEISKDLRDNGAVTEIYFPIQSLKPLFENTSKLRFIGIGLSAVMFLLAMALITNTVRLAIYSQRLTIRAKQLVGATNGFIRRPFLIIGFLQGLIGGVAASAMLVGALVFLANNFDPLTLIIDSVELKALLLCLVITGIAIGWLSSWLAVNRFLNRSLDQLV